MRVSTVPGGFAMRDNHGSLRVRFQSTGEEAAVDMLGLMDMIASGGAAGYLRLFLMESRIIGDLLTKASLVLGAAPEDAAPASFEAFL